MPMLLPAIGMITGVAASQIWPACQWWLLAAGIICFATLFAYGRHALSFVCLMTSIGAAVSISHSEPMPPECLYGVNARFCGEVTECEESANGTTRCIIRISRIENIKADSIQPAARAFKAILYTREYTAGLQKGAEVAFNGEILPLASRADMPFAVDYASIMCHQGVYAMATTYDQSLVVTKVAHGITGIANRMRNAMFNGIVESPVDGGTAAFLLAAILGNDSFIDDADIAAYRSTGLAHILALSGLHVAILASLIGIVLIPLRVSRHGIQIRCAITIMLIWAYAVITGMMPSVMRAAVMISLYLGAAILQRSPSPFNSLCMAVAIVLAADPASLFSVGFQLSFCSMISILAFMRLIPSSLRRHPVAYYAISATALPVAAMAGGGLVAMMYFGNFPFLFLIANLIAGLIFPWLLSGGFLLMVLQMAGVSFTALGQAVSFLHRLLAALAERLASITWAQASGISISAWAILPYAIFILLFVATIELRNRRTRSGRPASLTAAGAAMSLLATIAIATHPGAKTPALEFAIPSDGISSAILREGNAGCIIDLDGLASPMPSHPYITRYSRYFQTRKCDSVIVNPLEFHGNHATLINSHILLPTATIRIIKSDTLPNYGIPRTDYAIIARGFTGCISDVMATATPDTIVLATSLAPARKHRLKRECGDTIPVIDLKDRSLVITY